MFSDIYSKSEAPKHRLRLCLTTLLVGLLLGSTSSVSAMSSRDINRMHTLVFNIPLSQFMESSRRLAPNDRDFEWSSDLCSAPMIGSTGRSYDFRNSCRRHDFAYRNFKRANRDESCSPSTSTNTCTPTRSLSGQWWNSDIRHRIDRQFLSDMTFQCSTRPMTERLPCLAWAQVFYRSVRIAGGP